MHQGDSKGAPDPLKLPVSAGNGPFVQAELCPFPAEIGSLRASGAPLESPWCIL